MVPVIVALVVAALALAGWSFSALSAGETFTVNSTLDAVDASPGNKLCQTSTSTGKVCTLRAAIQEANALSGHQTIKLANATYALGIAPINANLAESGDLDITQTVTIVGASEAGSIVDGGRPPAGSPPDMVGLDRLFEVHPNAGNVTFQTLTLREGYSAEAGGAIENWSVGTLKLDRVTVRGNHAEKAGGGVNNIAKGRVDVIDSTFTGNAAGNGGAAINNSTNGTINILSKSDIVGNPGAFLPGSGAINNAGDFDGIGTIKVVDSTIANNVAEGNGAGILNEGDGHVILEKATFNNNFTGANGAGVYTVSGSLTVTDSTFTNNHAGSGGGIYAEGDTSKAGVPADIKFTKVTFRSNKAEAAAGASVGGDAKVTVTDSIFDQNQTVVENELALGTYVIGGGEAGGLSVNGRASATVLRGSFTKNVGNDYAGGLAIVSEKSSVIDSVLFDGNHAGDAGGGGFFIDGGGGTTLKNLKVFNNTSTGDGGGGALHAFGNVEVVDSEFRNNRVNGEESAGGGLEVSGQRATLTRLKVITNSATGNGGGIHNQNSDVFTLLDSHVEGNTAENGGGLTNASDSTLVIRRTLFLANSARNGPRDDHGMGGGVFSISDGGSLIENSTLSGNTATVAGGGLFHDADGELRLHNTTVWRNSAPKGGGLGLMESDVVPTVPPTAHKGFILKNTIVGGSLQGGGCDGALTSEGGNLEEGILCYLQGPRDKSSARLALDAISDNGGPTMTHALKANSLAVDRGIGPCILEDARGISRPQNRTCDSGAFEFVGTPLPPDDVAPVSEYLTGPVQDSEESSVFTFTATDLGGLDPADNVPGSPLEALTFECRLMEVDPTEPIEPLPPGVTPDPLSEEAWKGCQSPWQVKLVEDGIWNFEVRATDQQGNVGEPDVQLIDLMDYSPPETLILEKPGNPDLPGNPTFSRAATFTFSATDDASNPKFMEYECRLDSIDPDAWLECLNPTIFSNLTTGEHTIWVRATDAADNVDPTPARWTWTIEPPQNCDQANINLLAVADTWADEVNPGEIHMAYTANEVRAGPGEVARAFYRFALPTQTANCALESATLRLFQDGGDAGRTIQAVPITSPWVEAEVTWDTQPSAGGTAAEATSLNGEGYVEWDVTQQVINGAVANGFLIKDANEGDAEGGDNSFVSRKQVQDPPPVTSPILVLRYESQGLGPAPVPAEPVEKVLECGDVITESTRVSPESNLTDCPGEGLIIGRPNIILDLNGQVVDGPDYLLLEPGSEENIAPGVRNSGHDNVTIKNGTVQQFGTGILLTAGTTRNTVDGVTILRNAQSGIHLWDADDGRNGNVIKNVRVELNELGVQFTDGSENSAILNSQIHGNLGEAVMVLESSGIRIEGNNISGVPPDPALDSDGGFLVDGSSRNIIKDNVIHDTGDAGLVITGGANNNLIEDNILYRNGDAGINVQDSRGNKIINNVAHQESDGGVVLNNASDTLVRGNDVRFNPNGVDAGGSNNLVIEDNDASDSGADGIAVGNGTNFRILNNVANRTGGAGIAVESGSFDPNGVPIGAGVIKGNTTNQNAGDGIAVAAGGHWIGLNEAHNNAQLGITADGNVDGFLEGAGNQNKATGNGIEIQCVGVECFVDGVVDITPLDETPPDTLITSGPNGTEDAPFRSTTVVFEFYGVDPDNGTPPNILPGSPSTAMRYECRLDPMPDPEVTPEPTDEVDPTEVYGPNETVTPEPTEVPDSTDPPVTEGWAECTSPAVYQGLTPGHHHFEVRAMDFYQWEDLSPAEHDWYLEPLTDEEADDTTAPDTSIREMPAENSSVETAIFRFGGTDNATPGQFLKYECRMGNESGTTFQRCDNPSTFTVIPGSHTLYVRAVDRNGNKDDTPAVHLWTYTVPPPDETAPLTTVTSGPDFVTVRTAATFAFSANEENVTYDCALDPANPATATFADCTAAAGHALENLAVGSHTLYVKATDAAGNVEEVPVAFSWVITAAPVATDVACGQTITRSTLVNNDLLDCLDVGLNIGADNITLDLDGHIIDGKGVSAGIRNNGFDNVTIRNGTIQEFEYGVQLNAGTTRNIVEEIESSKHKFAGVGLTNADDGAVGNTLRNNTLTGSSHGVWAVSGTSGTTIKGNTFGANYEGGLRFENSTLNLVEGNQINGAGSSGIELVGATGTTIKGNTFNGTSILVGDPLMPAHGNNIEGNNIVDGGIEVLGSNRTQIVNNRVGGGNGEGVYLENSNDTLVKDNDLRHNKAGIGLKNASRNRIEGNNASETESTGIDLQAGSLRNVIIKNQVNINSAGGISMSDPASAADGNLVEGNTVSGNGSTGISVSNFGHTVKNNIADDNEGWGIYAVTPNNGQSVIDAGGNRAKENKTYDPVSFSNCYNVRCDGVATGPIDETPPETSLYEGPSASTMNVNPTFRFTGNDTQSTITFECRIETATNAAHKTWKECVSPHTFTNVNTGAHLFEVRAKDAAGNVDATPAKYNWTIMAPPTGVAPTVTILSGPDRVTVARTAKIEFMANEPGVTFQCSHNGAAFTGCSSPKDLANLGTREHTLQVKAIDSEGLEGVASYKWNVGFAPQPSEVGCGEILIRSTLVTNDLLDCEGDGLIIGAPGITVDLNGHMIDGNGLGAAILNTGHDDVTITNGIVQEFMYGVEVRPGAERAIVANMTVQLNEEAGIVLGDADNAQVRNNTVTGNGFGIHLTAGTRGAVIKGNTLEANQADGIRLDTAGGARIEANEINASGGAAVIIEGSGDNVIVRNNLSMNGGGILLGLEELPSNRNTIEANTIAGSTGPGVGLINSDGNTIRDNVISGSQGPGIGLELTSDDNLIRGNELGGNGEGVSMEESSRNIVDFNNVTGSGGAGIMVGTLSLGNKITNNVVVASGGEGIGVEDLGPSGLGTLIQGNTASSNGGEGIMVAAAGHTLRDNSVYTNGGWGVYAEAGNVDGGGHRAAGNAEPGECYNIACMIGDAPGAPNTEIKNKPANPSNSRYAMFTFEGQDDTTPLINIQYECRLDSTDPLAWDECEWPQEYLNLQPGTHTFEVRAIDEGMIPDSTPAKYTWTYAPVGMGADPDTEILSKPPANSPLLEWIFLVGSNEADVVFECRMAWKTQMGPWEQCGPEIGMQGGYYEAQIEEFEIGEHTFQARAIDIEGRIDPTPASYKWIVAGGPYTTIDNGPGYIPSFEPGEPAQGGPVESTTATFVYHSDNEPESTFYCALDAVEGAPNNNYQPCNTNDPLNPGAKTITYRGLRIGEHTFSVFAVSPDGLEEIETVWYEWEVLPPLENEAPVVELTKTPANNSSDTEFAFTGTDDLTPRSLLVFECSLDGAAFSECVSPYNLLENLNPQELLPGEHTFEVRAVDDTDPDGITGFPVEYRWTLVTDTTAPETTLLTTLPRVVPSDGALALEFTGSDNSTPHRPETPTQPAALLLDFECFLQTPDPTDIEAWEPCSSPDTLGGLDAGAHTLRIRAVDLFLNVDASPVSHTFTVVARPETEIVTTAGSVPESSTALTSANFTVQALNPDGTVRTDGVTYKCSLSTPTRVGRFETCASPMAYTDLVANQYTFAVYAVVTVDGFSIPDLEPDTYTWTVVDETPPQTSFGVKPPLVSLDVVARFTFASSEPLSEFECAVVPANTPAAEVQLSGCATPYPAPGQSQVLPVGMYTMYVAATDMAGNTDLTPATYTWEIRRAVLPVILTGPTETGDPTVTFSFTSNPPGATFECWLDAVITPCTSPHTYQNVPAGEHIFGLRATDADGVTNPRWAEWEFTMVEPAAVILQKPALQTEDTTARFTFTTFGQNATFECSLDGAEFLPCTSPKDYENLALGVHEFEVQTMYANPEYDPLPVLYIWEVVDLTAPNTFVDSGPTPVTASTTALFEFAAADLDGLAEFEPTFECLLDGAVNAAGEPDWQSCDVLHELQNLSEGSHTIEVRASDAAGNVDQTPAEYTWTVDLDASSSAATGVGSPVTVTLPMPNGTGGNATLTFAQVTAAGTTTVALVPDVPEPPALPETYSALEAQRFDISTTAAYTGSVTVCLSYNPDLFNSPESLSIAHYQEDPLEPGSFIWVNVMTSHDVDNAVVCGVVSSLSPFALVTPDLTIPPITTITAGPGEFPMETTVTFAFTADQIGSTFICTLDGILFEDCTSPKVYPNLTLGMDYEFEVYAVNGAGLAGDPVAYPFEFSEVMDTVAPNTRIVSGPSEGSRNANIFASFMFEGTDNFTAATELEFECMLDNSGVWESCTSAPLDPFVTEELTFGEHTLQVRAVDENLNFDPTPESRTWTVVDLTAPDTEFLTGPESDTTDTTATFTFALVDPDLEPNLAQVTFECLLNDGDFEPCGTRISADPLDGWTYTISNFDQGANRMHVRAIDSDGNIDGTPDIWEWIPAIPLDTTAPDTEILGVPTEPVWMPEQTIGLSATEAGVEFMCSLNNGPFEGCETSYEIGSLPAGEYTLRAYAIDEAGNEDMSPATASFIIAGPPDTEITRTPVDGSARVGTFEFRSNQSGVTFKCALNGNEFDCVSPFIATGLLLDEPNEFEVYAFRNVEVLDETPATYTWSVGSTPETFIVAEPESHYVYSEGELAPVVYAAVRGEDGETPVADLEFECSLNGAPFEACDFVYEEENPAPGQYVLLMRAVDEVGDFDPTPVEFRWTVGALPIATITDGPGETPDFQTSDRDLTFTFEADQSNVTFECSLNSTSDWVACGSPATFTNVPYGERYLIVRAVDAAGNKGLASEPYEWEAGFAVAPDVAFDAGTGPALTANPEDPTAPGQTSETTATFSYTSTDPAASFLCTLSGGNSLGTQVPCGSGPTASVTYENLIPGVYTFEVEATKLNLLSGVEQIVTDPPFEWEVTDVALPDTTISGAAEVETLLAVTNGGTTESATVEFTFAATNEADPTAVDFECVVTTTDGTPYQNGEVFGCASPQEILVETPGTYTLSVTAIDAALNREAEAATWTWTYAQTLPTVTLGTMPAPVSGNPNPTFTFAVNETIVEPGTIECGVNGSFGACSTALGEVSATQHVAEGLDVTDVTVDPVVPHTFQVRATDAYGNIGESEIYSWTIAAPVTTLTTTPEVEPDPVDPTAPGTTTETTATFEYEAESAATDVTGYAYVCAIDGVTQVDINGEPIDCGTMVELSGLALGNHEFEVYAVNNFGLVEEPAVTFNWTVIAPPPPSEAPQTTIDAAAVDTDVPATPLPTGSSTIETSAYFTFSSNQAEVTFECTLRRNGEAVAGIADGSCATGFGYSGLAAGDYTFTVAATNTASGLTDGSAAEWTWTVIARPDTFMTPSVEPPADGSPINVDTVTFSFVSDQAGATFECLYGDSADWVECGEEATAPNGDTVFIVTVGDLQDGEYSFAVRAVNNGLEDQSPVEWEADVQVAPVVTIVEIQRAGDTATVSFTGTDNSTSSANLIFECKLDSGAWEECGEPGQTSTGADAMTHEYTGLEAGEHTVSVRATDNSLPPGPNTSEPVSMSWTIEA